MAGVGLFALVALMWLLDLLGAPTWLTVLPWAFPTGGALLWAVMNPTPAVATDDDDDSWIGYSIRFVMFGEDEPRAVPARLVAAVLLGAPVAWALVVFGVLSIVGLM